MVYDHDHPLSQDKSCAINTVWPALSTNKVDVLDYKAYLCDRELSWHLAEDNGWYPSCNAGDNLLRVVIPAVVTKPQQVYWQARAVDADAHVRYQSPSGPRHGALIYTQFFAYDVLDSVMPTPYVVIVEGPMCSLAVAELGYDSIALMGINPGAEAIDHLIKLVDKRNTAICLDSEDDAQAHAFQLCLTLAAAGSNTRVVKIPQYKDIAAMPLRARKQFIKMLF